ncbi:PTS glucitol/sorbitol transporter subunit IIB, partial [Leptospira borgpetersenii serovar Hardjo-bovis]|nr:PTS glucitol/sorbitol transporter subunit IIB [Leptospira borgpetersenii serovar Hardjo-bovis]
PGAREMGAITETEVVNGFSDIPHDNDILCVVINCAGSLRCGLYPQKGIPTINVLPTWRAGPLAQFISEDNYVSAVTLEPLDLGDTAEAPDSPPEPVSVTSPRIITTPPPARAAEQTVSMIERPALAGADAITTLPDDIHQAEGVLRRHA